MARETAEQKAEREAAELTGDSGIEPVEGGKVHVPQADGEIVFTGHSGKRTFRVTDHMVSPKNDDERAQLLLLVEGAKLAD